MIQLKSQKKQKDSQLDMVENASIKHSMEAMRLQALENHKAMEELRKENTDNQSKLFDLLSKKVDSLLGIHTEQTGTTIK